MCISTFLSKSSSVCNLNMRVGNVAVEGITGVLNDVNENGKQPGEFYAEKGRVIRNTRFKKRSSHKDMLVSRVNGNRELIDYVLGMQKSL